MHSYLSNSSDRIYSVFHTAKQINYDKMVDDEIYMTYPFPSSWTVTFTREGESEEDVLIREGNLVYQMHSVLSPFTGRFEAYSEGISIAPLRRGDSGTFEFKDQDGNLAQRVQLEVMQGERQHSLLL